MRHAPIALAIAATLACGPVAAQSGQQGSGHADSQFGVQKPTAQAVMEIIRSWEKTARFAAQVMMQKYGPPEEATATYLVWFNNGPWKRSVVTNAPTSHDFPLPHQDVMEQTVNYQVPPDKFDELAAYDGSVYVDRTRGEISARCDLEPANFIALNLAHDIVTGKRSVEEAREQYADLVIRKMTTTDAVPYAEKLTFDPPKSAGFSDKTVIGQDVLQKVKERKQAMMEKVLGSAAAGGSAASGASAKAAGDPVMLKSSKSEKYGSYLTDADGRAVYMFEADERGKGQGKPQSNCYDACAKAWPPLTGSATPQSGTKVDKSLVGTIERKDGSQQLTYNGWPLYYFVKDSGPGQTKGQDVHGFGGGWYLVSPEGKVIGTDAAAGGTKEKSGK